MILKPLLQQVPETQIDPIAQALEVAGLKQSKEISTEKGDEETVIKRVKNALNTAGASIEDASTALATAMQAEDTRLQAAKLVFELHGALRDKSKQEIPAISIVINGVGAAEKPKSLLSILAPRETTLDGNAA